MSKALSPLLPLLALTLATTSTWAWGSGDRRPGEEILAEYIAQTRPQGSVLSQLPLAVQKDLGKSVAKARKRDAESTGGPSARVEVEAELADLEAAAQAWIDGGYDAEVNTATLTRARALTDALRAATSWLFRGGDQLDALLAAYKTARRDAFWNSVGSLANTAATGILVQHGHTQLDGASQNASDLADLRAANATHTDSVALNIARLLLPGPAAAGQLSVDATPVAAEGGDEGAAAGAEGAGILGM